MDYLISFLEGTITFVSPCMLPMLPIYISYFAGQDNEASQGNTLRNAIGFVTGFTIVFILLGAFAGTVGGFFREYRTAVNILSGGIVILFGLNFMEVINIPLLNSTRKMRLKSIKPNFTSSVVFGIIFSIGWTPCVGAFLGSALMLAASSGESMKGILMLLSFSMGLGIPFIASAVLIDRLKSTFDFIKRNYKVINFISGAMLVLIGILMATGYMGYFLAQLTF